MKVSFFGYPLNRNPLSDRGLRLPTVDTTDEMVDFPATFDRRMHPGLRAPMCILGRRGLSQNLDLHPTVHHNSSRFINLKIQISKVQAVAEIKFCLIHLVDLPNELFQTLRCLPPPVLGLGNMTSWRFHGHPWAPSVWCVEKLWKHICDSTSEKKSRATGFPL